MGGIHNQHDVLYREFFSHPKLVEELLRCFVDEEFVQDLDFSTLRTEDTQHVTAGLRKRASDLIYEISFRGKPMYIYLLLELQSAVDRFMADRLLEYVRAFSRIYCKTRKTNVFPPVFPVVLYNGDKSWTAPTQFSDLVAPSPIPSRYVPQFSYFLIEINKIPKRKLLSVRNALSAIFYVESSSREDIGKSLDTLIQFIRDDLPAVYPKFLTWFFDVQELKVTPEMAEKLTNGLEVHEMLRTRVLAERKAFLEEGREIGREEVQTHIIERMILNKMETADIRKNTGVSAHRIEGIRKGLGLVAKQV